MKLVSEQVEYQEEVKAENERVVRAQLKLGKFG